MRTNLDLREQTMTSLEIAELTGKPHNDVLKAIRKMEPAWMKVTQGKFSLSSYQDATGRTLPCYELTKNDSIFERLDIQFTTEQAMQQSVAVKGANVNHNTVRQMLKNWRKQGWWCWRRTGTIGNCNAVIWSRSFWSFSISEKNYDYNR